MLHQNVRTWHSSRPRTGAARATAPRIAVSCRRKCYAGPAAHQNAHALSHALLRTPSSLARQPVSCHSVDTSTATQATAKEPDLVLQAPSGTVISVFGVEHLERETHIGEYILQHSPAVVVVETAATPAHGADPGNTITCRDQVPGAAGFFLRIFCQIAAALQEQGPDSWKTPLSPWQQAAQNFNGEQLAYIAAFARGSTLVFGDRPKDVTYKRLASIPTAKELDAAYAAEVVASYSQLVADGDAAVAAAAQAALSQTRVWDVMMKEREVVMCAVVDALAQSSLPQAPSDQPPKEVVLVLGSAHLPGIDQLWKSGEWKELLGAADLSSSPLLKAPEQQQQDLGVRRGLLEAVLQLSVTQEVLDDVAEVLPAITSPEEAAAHQWAYEIYSSPRMQLAVLPDDLLQQVCSAVKGCSMPELLEPLQQLRPVNGGKGWDEELGVMLRGLNFEMEAEE